MTTDDGQRAVTAAELRDDFMDSCRGLVDYWSAENIDRATVHERLSGLLHSVLCLIDGASSGFPCAITLTADPHPDDKEFRRAEGENWVEPGTAFNAEDMLHELIYGQGSWRGRPPGGGGVARASGG